MQQFHFVACNNIQVQHSSADFVYDLNIGTASGPSLRKRLSSDFRLIHPSYSMIHGTVHSPKQIDVTMKSTLVNLTWGADKRVDKYFLPHAYKQLLETGMYASVEQVMNLPYKITFDMNWQQQRIRLFATGNWLFR